MAASMKEESIAETLENSLLLRLLHILCWFASFILTVLALIAIIYQLYALYIPYSISMIRGDEAYRFPDYFYRVWGDEIKHLTYEHWGYLFASTAAVSFSSLVVLPDTPFQSSDKIHHHHHHHHAEKKDL